MSRIKKYLKKDTYLQKKGRKLLVGRDQYNSMIIEYQKIINLIDNIITDRIMKVSKIVANENNKETH